MVLLARERHELFRRKVDLLLRHLQMLRGVLLLADIDPQQRERAVGALHLKSQPGTRLLVEPNADPGDPIVAVARDEHAVTFDAGAGNILRWAERDPRDAARYRGCAG